MTYGGAPEMRDRVDAILNELHSHIVALHGIKQAMQETGSRVLALNAYETEVNSVGANLMNEFGRSSQAIDDAINAHRAYISQLEYYRDQRI